MQNLFPTPWVGGLPTQSGTQQIIDLTDTWCITVCRLYCIYYRLRRLFHWTHWVAAPPLNIWGHQPYLCIWGRCQSTLEHSCIWSCRPCWCRWRVCHSYELRSHTHWYLAKRKTNKMPCKYSKNRHCSDGLMIWVCILIPVGFLALWTELMLGLNCIKTAAGDDSTKSFWVTVLIHRGLYFRAEGKETFSWSLILIAFLQRFNEQTQSLDFHCANLSREL